MAVTWKKLAFYNDFASPPEIGSTTPGIIRGFNKCYNLVDLLDDGLVTLTAAQVAGTFLNNYGQDGNIAVLLPDATAGMNFVLDIGTDHTGDELYLGSLTCSVFFLNVEYEPIAAINSGVSGVGFGNDVGACIAFRTFQIGASEYAWIATPIIGNWYAIHIDPE